MFKLIDTTLINKTIKEAHKSSRRRAHSRFHDYKDPVQRMVNVYMKDAYIQPHKHDNPDKVEVFLCLKGKFLALSFNHKGTVTERIIFGEKEKIRGVEIPPKTWHAFWALEDDSVIYEVIQGPYDAKTHKKFAPWAPSEKETEKAAKYMMRLKEKYVE